MIKKLIAIGIIFLFIGTSTVQAETTSKNNIITNHNEGISADNTLFDGYINLLMKIGHLPSLSVGVIKNDELIFSKGYGSYDLENKKETDLDTIYPVGSVTKTITATAVMQLCEKGFFDLDDDVSNFLPFELRNPNFPDVPITFRMFLSHHSSIIDDELECHILPGDPNITTYPEQYYRDLLLPNGSLYNPDIWSSEKPPGEIQYYTESPWGLIELIIENLTGFPFNDYCKENIFYPLEMYNTSYRLYDLDIDRVALPYEYLRGSYHRLLHYSWLPYAVGNIRTTIPDLSHFLIAHMNGGVWNGVRILNESTVEEMHRIQYPEHGPEWNRYYGLGFLVINPNKPFKKEMIGHTGFPHNRMYYSPADKAGIIIMENSVCFSTASRDSGLGCYINDFFMANSIRMIMQILFIKANLNR